MMSHGLFLGWSSPSVPILLGDDSPVLITLQQASWIISIHSIGAVVAGVFSIYVVNLIGRKRILLFSAIPGVIGWMIIAFATSTWELILGRFICGLSTGLGYVTSMMYVGEISPANIRGAMTGTLTVAAKFGLFVEWVIGPFLTVRHLAFASSLVPVLFFVSLLPFPESPYHFMRHGRRDKAITSLVQLRGTTDVSKEADTIEKFIKIDLNNSSGLCEILSVPGNRKALIVLLGLFTIQQWSGSYAVLSYAEFIFDLTGNQFEGKYITMIIGGMQVVFTLISSSVVDRYSRRLLLITSAFGTCITTFLVGLFFFLQSIKMNVDPIVWLPAIALILYNVLYAFGLAAVPFILMGELFPTNVKVLGNAIGMLSCLLSSVAVSLLFPNFAEQFGVHVAFWLFSIISILGVLFVYCYVPETKGKTLQEIQQQLHELKVR
ncbi:facilitated trehalose transporter Tret1-like [Xylocopa sonorina]|uniref:facilitated trehalose transporter Tret1-like n=1 Tax=Xylocopa sonorina TaxID=1818115 RepID=UPI00403B13F8